MENLFKNVDFFIEDQGPRVIKLRFFLQEFSFTIKAGTFLQCSKTTSCCGMPVAILAPGKKDSYSPWELELFPDLGENGNPVCSLCTSPAFFSTNDWTTLSLSFEERFEYFFQAVVADTPPLEAPLLAERLAKFFGLMLETYLKTKVEKQNEYLRRVHIENSLERIALELCSQSIDSYLSQ